MNNHSKYITKKNNRAMARAILLFLVGAIVIIILSVLVDNYERRPVEPDVTYPMANANIGWNQTFYAGGWSEGT